MENKPQKERPLSRKEHNEEGNQASKETQYKESKKQL